MHNEGVFVLALNPCSKLLNLELEGHYGIFAARRGKGAQAHRREIRSF